MTTPIVKYSHDRIGQRWTLRDHATLLEFVHEQAKAAIEAKARLSALESQEARNEP